MLGRCFPRHAAFPFVVARFHPGENLVAVHHIRLEVNGRATIETRRHQVARVNVAARADRRHILGLVLIGRQAGLLRHRPGDGLGQLELFGKGAAQEFLQHFKTLIIQLQFVRQISPVDEQMQMIFFHQSRLIRIAPRLGVEMQAEHEVRLADW